MSTLLHLSDADLEALSSRLTLRRARRDLEAGLQPDRTTPQPDGLVLTWPDAICSFSSRGLSDSRCTCPARRLCRHRVRSVLHLKQQAAKDGKAPAADWSPAVWTLLELERAAGRTLWKKARIAMAEGLTAARESETAARIDALGIRVRFLPRQSLAAAVCSCGSTQLCIHRVLAALAWQDALPASAPERAAERVRQRVWQRLAALLATGLDGAPPEAADGLRALAQRVAQDLPAPARDLGQLADTMASYQARSARSGGQQWLWQLGRLGARLLALAAPRRTAPTVALRGQGRRAHIAASDLRLIGLGAEGFQGGRGTVVKCWFFVPDTGAWVHASVGRGHMPDADPLPPRALWNVPLWSGNSAADLANVHVWLRGAKLSPDGALSSANVVAQPLPDPVLPAQLPEGIVADRVSVLAEQWRQQAPPILRRQQERWMPAIVELASERPFRDVPTFSEDGQRLTLPVALRSGERITLSVPFSPGSEQTVTALERVYAWPAAPTHMLVRFWPSDDGVHAWPVSVWLRGQTRPVSLGIGPPIVSRRRAPKRTVVTARPAPAVDPFLERLRLLLDLMESIAVEGLTQGRWRLETLRSAAARLEDDGLSAGASQVHRLADAIQTLSLQADRAPDDAAAHFVRLLAWATAIEEAWQLARISRSPPTERASALPSSPSGP